MVLQWAMILVLSLLVFSLMRQLGELTLRLNGEAKEPAETYAPFSKVPESMVPLVNGGTYQFGGAQPTPSMVVFFSPECSACALLPEALRDFTSKVSRTEVNLLVVIRVGRPAAQKYIEGQGLAGVAIAVEEDIPEQLKPGRAPFGVSFTNSGLVAARGKPKALAHLLQMAQAAQTMDEAAPSHSIRTHEWGESAPYWELNENANTGRNEKEAVLTAS
ncbi:MAG: redoxin protein [Pedosphaera sp.]|nr:redoxin protein [Pedosphaera sp.]